MVSKYGWLQSYGERELMAILKGLKVLSLNAERMPVRRQVPAVSVSQAGLN